jgi:hypothetical protein
MELYYYFIIGGKENEHLFYIVNYHHYGDIKWNH